MGFMGFSELPVQLKYQDLVCPFSIPMGVEVSPSIYWHNCGKYLHSDCTPSYFWLPVSVIMFHAILEYGCSLEPHPTDPDGPEHLSLYL